MHDALLLLQKQRASWFFSSTSLVHSYMHCLKIDFKIWYIFCENLKHFTHLLTHWKHVFDIFKKLCNRWGLMFTKANVWWHRLEVWFFYKNEVIRVALKMNFYWGRKREMVISTFVIVWKLTSNALRHSITYIFNLDSLTTFNINKVWYKIGNTASKRIGLIILESFSWFSYLKVYRVYTGLHSYFGFAGRMRAMNFSSNCEPRLSSK